MKLFSGLFACLLIVGCATNTATVPTAITIQMDYNEVPAIMDAYGGVLARMKGLQKEDSVDRFYAYNLPDGRVVLMAVSKTVNRISNLSVCEMPKQKDGERVWKKVPRVSMIR
jgi:hypothetical protein